MNVHYFENPGIGNVSVKTTENAQQRHVADFETAV